MKLVLLPGLINVNEDVFHIVHLLPDVSIHIIGNVGFVVDLVMESMDSLSRTFKIFTQFVQVLGVQALNQHLVVELVIEGVVHDNRDTFLLCDLGEFVMTGRIGEFLCGDSEKELFLEIMNGQGVDTDVVEGVGGVDGICPDNGAGVDRTIYPENSRKFSF